MKTLKKIAIYLDHSEAKLFEYDTTVKLFKIIKSNFHIHDKNKILQKGESHLHHKEQQFEHQYYENIAKESLNFNEVLLFGATEAKTELFNFLVRYKHYDAGNLKIKSSDKLTKKQQLAFVYNYFSKLK